MPLLPGLRQVIELPVSDRKINDTVIRQKALFVALQHVQTPEGICSARIQVQVTMYAAAAAGFGEPLISAGFMPRTLSLVADNDTVVDAQTGAILAIRQPAHTDEQWQQVAEGFQQPVMLQGDFFEALRESQDIRIGDMIRQHIQQADQMGRFA